MQSNAKRSRSSGRYSGGSRSGNVRSTASQRAALRGMSMAAAPRAQNYNRPSAASVAKAIAKAGDTGYHDTNGGDWKFNTTGHIHLLNNVGPGASVLERVGKKISLKSLQFRGLIQNGPTAVYNKAALLIIYDKRPGEALPLISAILMEANSLAMNNDDNSGRFRTLLRKDLILSGPRGAPYGVQPADFYLDLKGAPTVYKSTGTGGMGDIEQGALYAVCVGDHGAEADHDAVLYGNFRCRFVDV